MELIVYLKITKHVFKIKVLFVILKTQVNAKLIIILKIVLQLMDKIVIMIIKAFALLLMDSAAFNSKIIIYLESIAGRMMELIVLITLNINLNAEI